MRIRGYKDGKFETLSVNFIHFIRSKVRSDHSLSKGGWL